MEVMCGRKKVLLKEAVFFDKKQGNLISIKFLLVSYVK